MAGSAELRYRRGDLVFTASDTFLGRAIRWATGMKQKTPVLYNHVAMVINDTDDINEVQVIEATRSGVDVGPLSSYLSGNNHNICVAFSDYLLEKQRVALVKIATEHIGTRYGFGMILYFLGQEFLESLDKENVKIFEDRLRNSKSVVCSTFIAMCFSFIGENFGKQPFEATPEDIYEYVKGHQEQYPIVYSYVSFND